MSETKQDVAKRKWTWQQVHAELVNWRQWNWRRIGLSIVVYAPLSALLSLSIYLGFPFFMVGLLELFEIVPRLADTISPVEHIALVNDTILIIGVGLLMMQAGLFTLVFFYPKADAWIAKKSKRSRKQ